MDRTEAVAVSGIAPPPEPQWDWCQGQVGGGPSIGARSSARDWSCGHPATCFNAGMVTMYEIMENLRAGDHAALFYRTRAEQLAIIVPFIAIGLKRGERCLYIADDNSVAMIAEELERGDVDVEGAQKSGALTISTKHHTYLRHGVFEPARMTDDLIHEVQESIRLGYTAFRAAGEMTWALSLPSALAQLSDYETRLHAQFPGQFCGLCQYDERGFNDRVIADMIRIHPIVIARGKLLQNRFHQPGATAETLLPDLVTVDEVVDAGTGKATAPAH